VNNEKKGRKEETRRQRLFQEFGRGKEKKEYNIQGE